MKSSIATIFILVSSFGLLARPVVTQTGSGPITKQELISLVKQVAQHKLSQADVVAEVEQRGINFTVDEKVLSELRQAGARTFLLDAVQRAAQNSGRPLRAPGDMGEVKGEVKADAQTSAQTIASLPMIEQTRRLAIQYAEDLPNFIVNQHVERSIQTPDKKDWKLDDTLDLEITFREGKGEQYKLLRINGKPVTQTYESLGGTTSTGEFGSLLAAIFVPQSKAEFKEVRKELFRNRETVIYDFKVKKANSVSTVEDKESGQKTVAGYSGSLWIDAETKHVLRVEFAHEGMPPAFPINLSESAVEYDWVTIAGDRYLLPVRAEVLLGRERDRVYTRNVIEFRNYQKFEAKIKVPSDQ